MIALALLLGVTMTVLAGCVWFGYLEYKTYSEAIKTLEERVGVLERRKAVIAEAVAGQPKPAGVAGRRTWAETKNELENQVPA